MTSDRLQFYIRGGGLVPFATMLAVIMFLAINGKAGTSQFWAGGYLGIAAGLLLCRNKTAYCNAMVRGICNQTGAVIIVAWIFASVLGKVVVSAGLIGGVLWIGEASGLEGRYFTLIAFFSAMLFSTGTGTANGTVLALTPVLYPAGVALGADPRFLALAILSGAAFGDNVAPISDTTILSAFTQGTSMKAVIRSRLPLALTAAVISVAILLVVGGSNAATAPPALDVQTNPVNLLLLLALAVVVISALSNRHIVESLLYGTVSAILMGIAIDGIVISDVFALPAERGESTGLLQDAIGGVMGPIIFVLLVMSIVQIFNESGHMSHLIEVIKAAIAKSIQAAEFAIAGISVVVAAIVTSNGAAILLVGPTVVRQLGERFGLAPHRCANLMDCGVCSVFYMLPWTLAVLVWHASTESAAIAYNLDVPPITSSVLAPYPWALLLVLIFSIMTGWNRDTVDRPHAS